MYYFCSSFLPDVSGAAASHLTKQFKKTTATRRTSLNKRFNEQYNDCARALYFLVYLFTVLFKTTTLNGQILRSLENLTTTAIFLFNFFYGILNLYSVPKFIFNS